MGKIFCIFGKSASGKDSIYRELLKRDCDLNTYVMYTTRPVRQNEQEGVAYHFVTDEKILEFEKEGSLIEKRVYNTIYGPWTYATVNDGQINLSAKSYLMPATLESFLSLRHHFGDDKVYPVYIEVEDGERLLRAIKREKREPVPKYKELCRRFLSDAEDFSEEKLKDSGIKKRFENRDKEQCINEILQYIKEIKQT